MIDNSYSCPDCFKDIRSRNDILASTIQNAKKISLQEEKPVAIIADGPGFRTEVIDGAIPGGTIDIINEVQ